MDARTQRTILRLLSVFLAAGAGDAIIQFAASTTYDWHHLAAALVAAAIVAAEQYLKNTGDNAPPTVGAVNDALKPLQSIASITATPTSPVTFSAAAPPRTVAPPSESRSA
jgi:hypothetical protein